jgi:hypothetical protein
MLVPENTDIAQIARDPKSIRAARITRLIEIVKITANLR